MAGKREVNIFRVLNTIRTAWVSIDNYNNLRLSAGITEEWLAAQRPFQFEGSDVRETFLAEFEDFLFSCEWTTSEVVKEIVGYIKAGTPLNQIGNLVGLKESAFRMRIIRMTNTINDLLFDGRTCPEGICSLTDVGALKKCLIKLRLLRKPVDFSKEFSLWQLGWIKDHIGKADSFNAERENLDIICSNCPCQKPTTTTSC